MANQMAKACNPYFFHLPIADGIEMPSYGFPWTSAEAPRGQVYEFKLNHVVEVDDSLELVRFHWIDLAADAAKEPTHAQAERCLPARALQGRRPLLGGHRPLLRSREANDRHNDDPAIQPDSVAQVYGVESSLVSVYKAPDLNMVKISYPRPTAQGGVVERDLHSGQQYVYLLDVEMR